MKIKIESDVFDIAKRLKQINESYYILFDTSKQKFELHSKEQQNSYCFSYPFQNLDNRFLDMVYTTNIRYIDNIIEDIDKNNIEIERIGKQKTKSQTDYMLKEIYCFANNSSKELDETTSFSSVWR